MANNKETTPNIPYSEKNDKEQDEVSPFIHQVEADNCVLQ